MRRSSSNRPLATPIMSGGICSCSLSIQPKSPQAALAPPTSEASSARSIRSSIRRTRTASVWQSAYFGINRANSVIDRVPTIEMDPTRRDQIVGEAKFLRAVHYYFLAGLFGGVPLKLEPTSSIEGATLPRECEGHLGSDCKGFERPPPLPNSWPAGDFGQATKGAALTLLGKSYLQAAATGRATLETTPRPQLRSNQFKVWAIHSTRITRACSTDQTNEAPRSSGRFRTFVRPAPVDTGPSGTRRSPALQSFSSLHRTSSRPSVRSTIRTTPTIFGKQERGLRLSRTTTNPGSG